MLDAITDDIAALPGVSVVTTVEAGLRLSSNVEVFSVSSPAEEAAVFRKLLPEVDAVLVIAPETDGILAGRCRVVRNSGTASWNCLPETIDLCGDKLLLAEHLRRHEIPTISTTLCDLANPSANLSWPVVLKPRDGAGASLTFCVKNPQEWEHAAQTFRDAMMADKCLCQPFVPGRALSVSVNCGLEGRQIECMPIGEQLLACDHLLFRYLGGTIPAKLTDQTRLAIDELVDAACQTMTGLVGYIGFDLVLPPDGDPLIVEINPRLTTSYIGYRQLFQGKIPSSWFTPADSRTMSAWKPGPIEFSSFTVDDASPQS